MGDETQFDEYGQIIQEDEEGYLDSMMMENQGSVVLTYDSDEEQVGPAEKEQFTKAVQVLEDSGRAEVEDVTYIEDVVAGEGSLTAVVYTEDVDEVENFVEPRGQGPELAVKRVSYDMDIPEELESYVEEAKSKYTGDVSEILDQDNPLEGVKESSDVLKSDEVPGLESETGFDMDEFRTGSAIDELKRGE